jgi:hypothetical protein
MKSIYSYIDPHLGACHIVIPKIRQVGSALGNLLITFDNGEKVDVYTNDLKATTQELLEAIERFYESRA